jgi:hypothetical protein
VPFRGLYHCLFLFLLLFISTLSLDECSHISTIFFPFILCFEMRLVRLGATNEVMAFLFTPTKIYDNKKVKIARSGMNIHFPGTKNVLRTLQMPLNLPINASQGINDELKGAIFSTKNRG